MKPLLYVLVFLESLGVGLLLVPWVIRLALRWHIVDRPGERKVHSTPKPLLGGVAIFWAVTGVVGVNLTAYHLAVQQGWIHHPLLARFSFYLPEARHDLFILLGGGLVMHLLGLVDDLFKGKLTYRSKFPVQIAVALGVALSGIRVEFMPGRVLEIVMTVLWIVAITNGFNLLDNMDGLAAGVACIATALLFVVATFQQQVFFALFLAALLGACLAFLFYNWSPSRLFMGDSGSLFIGFLFGALTVSGSYVVEESASLLPIFIPLLVLSIPIYDTLSVIYLRCREGRPLFEGDKRHFSHRLVELGMSPRAAVAFIYVVGLAVGLTALLLPYVTVAGSLVVLFQAILVYTLITILISVGKKNRDRRDTNSL